jgi:hypothetical protein
MTLAVRPYYFIFFMAVVVMWMTRIYYDDKRGGLLALAILLGANQASAPELPREPIQPAGQVLPYIVGGAVIIGGGYVIIKIARYCQRRFPKDPPKTNAPPEEASVPSNSYAASWHLESTSCFEPASVLPTTFLEIESTAAHQLAAKALASQEPEEWESDLIALGLAPNESYSYAFNGRPSIKEAMPFEIFCNGQMVIVSGPEHDPVTIVERSFDRHLWETVAMLRLPTKLKLRLYDSATTDHMFYRTRTIP